MICPVCHKKTLKFHKSEMNGFSWAKPYIDCFCGFSFMQNFSATGIQGITCFENELIQKEQAEFKIKQLFKIT